MVTAAGTRRKGLLVVLVAIVVVAGAAITILLFPSGKPSIATSNAEPPQVQSNPIHDSTLLDLIQNAKVAVRKNDDVTRRAMVGALRRDRLRAKQLINGQIAKSTDPKDKEALGQILREVP